MVENNKQSLGESLIDMMLGDLESCTFIFNNISTSFAINEETGDVNMQFSVLKANKYEVVANKTIPFNESIEHNLDDDMILIVKEYIKTMNELYGFTLSLSVRNMECELIQL